MADQSQHWYKDAILYELHVRSFHDSVGDGSGDFRGLTQKLDYLQDLGITAIWLLPFYPSPLKDDGYDTADYTNINPQYGTMESFREFLDAAHARGLRVITELVLNHTSDQHPWFQRARRSPPGSAARDFYVWSDTPTKYPLVRIIFQDFETSNWTYDNVAQAYYWHRFYSHQPDLNFDNPEVVQAMLPVVDFWFGLGVDGLRLDAVPYLFEREGTNCENLPETHEFLKLLRRHVDEKFPGRMLLAEANQWPEHAVAYFGNGDECHMAFHFPVMPRLFMAMHMGDRFPIVDIMQQTPPIPENCQWAMFLRNHDELTLEMVSDEERDYMYLAFAHDQVARVNLGIRRRLAPLLGNNRRRMELMNGLLFSLPWDAGRLLWRRDRDGRQFLSRRPQRSANPHAMECGSQRRIFACANPQKLFLPIIIDPEYHYESINVEAQQNNPHSLLWWMKRLIALRRQHAAFSRGDIQFLDPNNRKILAFTRNHAGDTLLIVANLSRFVQYVELNLDAYTGATPIELFGSVPFPRITLAPYLLTLGPHSFYWFELSRAAVPEAIDASAHPPHSVPRFPVRGEWERLFAHGGAHEFLLAARMYLHRSLGQHGFDESVRNIRVRDAIQLGEHGRSVVLLILHAEFHDTGPNALVLPVAFASDEEVQTWAPEKRAAMIAHVDGSLAGVLYDPTQEPWFGTLVLELIQNRRRFVGRSSAEIVAWTTSHFVPPTPEQVGPPQVTRVEQYNTSVRCGSHSVLKFVRRTEEGIHPEIDMGRLLTELHPSQLAAPPPGALEYRQRRTDPMLLAVLHQFVVHEGNAWQFTLDHLSNFFEQVAARHELLSTANLSSLATSASPWEHAYREPPEIAWELIGDLLPMVGLLGQRLAELHRALAAATDAPAFTPEPITPSYQRALYQSMRALTLDVVFALEQRWATLPDLHDLAHRVSGREHELLTLFRHMLDRPIQAHRIRCHGDCHLGQVLFTGKDFIFIDFEGPPNLSIGERRIKRPAIRDVVEMLRSFDDAAFFTLQGLASGRGRPIGFIRDEDRKNLRPWAAAWRTWVSGMFVKSYLSTAGDASFVPRDDAEQFRLFEALLLQRTLVDLRQRLDRAPNAIRHLLEFLDQLPQM